MREFVKNNYPGVINTVNAYDGEAVDGDGLGDGEFFFSHWSNLSMAAACLAPKILFLIILKNGIKIAIII